MRYYAISGALVGAGAGMVIVGALLWRVVDSFRETGESHLLFPDENAHHPR